MTIAPAEPGPTAHMRPPRAVREESQDQADQLTEALVKARLELGATVLKEGFNRKQEYNYVGHEQVLKQGARAALLKFGLALEQRCVEFKGELTFTTRNGAQTCWRWVGTHALVHVSGAERLYTFEATTGTNDKAAFVASTALDRTAHLRILELAGSDEEDPEHNSHDQRAQAQAQPAQGAQKAAEKAEQKAVDEKQAQAAVKGFLGWLAPLDQPAALIEWARELSALNVHKNEKKVAWDAFGARCNAVGLDAADIAEAARQAPP